jgi:hypothetical protein
MRTWKVITLLLLSVIVLAGCAARQPLVFDPAPWHDGEIAEYDLLDRSGAVVGSGSWSWHVTPEGWLQSYTLTLGERVDSKEVLLSADLSPIRSYHRQAGTTYEATYDTDAVHIVAIQSDGEPKSARIRRPNDAVDNSASLQVQRALPLAEGYATRYNNVIPATGAVAAMQVRVAGAETLTTPAGTFETWHVVMTAGQSRHEAWYTRDAAHLMVKYHNVGAGTQFVLRGASQ